MNRPSKPLVSNPFTPVLVIIDGDCKYEYDEKNRLRSLTDLVGEAVRIAEYDKFEDYQSDPTAGHWMDLGPIGSGPDDENRYPFPR